MLEMVAIVHGSVQGVGFRAKTKTIADQLHLTGYVRNLSDGSVEILAQGEENELESLLERLKSAFGSKYIESIDCTFSSVQNAHQLFSIEFS